MADLDSISVGVHHVSPLHLHQRVCRELCPIIVSNPQDESVAELQFVMSRVFYVTTPK